MGANRVIFGNETLMDISEDTVNENNLLLGATAHDADGNSVVGAVITHDVIDNLTSTSTEDALSANQGKVLNESKLPINNPKFTGSLTNYNSANVGVLISGTSITVQNVSPSTQYTRITNTNVSTSSGHSLTSKANSNLITDNYDSTVTYNIGDFCIQNNKLWKCKLECQGEAPSGDTEHTYWDQTTIGEELKGGGGSSDVYLTGTLLAGDTTMTFTHESLTSDSCIDIYTDKSELGWLSRSVVGTTLTITFPPQTTNTSIKIKVSGGI